VLPGKYTVSKLAPCSPIPGWVAGDGIVNITYAADEISVVCLSQRVPEEIEGSAGWTAIKLATKFDFDEPGVILSVVKPVSESGLGVFVFSTFYRDYLLVQSVELSKVKKLLLSTGHSFV
jgi:uncharacterized protein